MEIEIGYHRRAAAFAHHLEPALVEMLDGIRGAEYPPDTSRKQVREAFPKAERPESARSLFKDIVTSVMSADWTREVPLFDTSSLPGLKLHYIKDRVGVVRSFGNRITVGTDVLRLERAYHPTLSLIDVGVFICGTAAFEDYYFSTETRRGENMITFEEILEYLEMIADLIVVPIVVVGIKPPEL